MIVDVIVETSQRQRITDLASLRELVGTPSERAVKKQLPALDAHARAFLERSPFVLLGTSSTDGRCDVSPKGDYPGFTLVVDDSTLVIPDRLAIADWIRCRTSWPIRTSGCCF